MIIGIDIDGVILDTENLFNVYAELYDIEKKKTSIKEEKSWLIEKRYNWTDEEIKEYWEKHVEKVTQESSFVAGADVIIRKLKDQGHTLIINTARGIEDGFTSKKLREILIESAKEKFKKEKLTFSKYYWAVTDKSIPCKNENIDIMIEDNYGNCLKVAKEKIHSIYLQNSVYPKTIENEYIHEANNWGEIYRIIQNYKKSIE